MPSNKYIRYLNYQSRRENWSNNVSNNCLLLRIFICICIISIWNNDQDFVYRNKTDFIIIIVNFKSLSRYCYVIIFVYVVLEFEIYWFSNSVIFPNQSNSPQIEDLEKIWSFLPSLMYLKDVLFFHQSAQNCVFTKELSCFYTINQ